MSVIEYAMRMKDMMSGPLGKIADAYDNVSSHAEKAGKSASLFSKLSSLSFGANNILNAGGALINGVKSVASAIGSTMQAALDRQQLQVSFDVLTGSKEAGGKLTQELVDLQKNTILGAEVFKNAQTMLGFGFKDTEIVENMRMLGDVSMGDAEKLNSLTLAFSQIRSAGKLQGQDLLQLINAGFNPLEAMSERTGKSIGELKDEMSKGNISFEMVQQAFRDATGEGGKFNNMLATIAQTDAGMKAQLSGAFEELKVKIGNAFAPLTHLGLKLGTKLMPILERMADVLAVGVQRAVSGLELLMSKAQTLKSNFEQFAAPFVNLFNTIRENISGLAEYFEPVRALIVEHVWPVIMKIYSVFAEIIGDIVEFVAQSELLKDTFSFIGKILGGVADMFGYLVDGLKWLWNNIVMPILNGIEKAYRWLKGSDMEGGSNKAITASPAAATPKTTEQKETPATKKLNEIAKNTKANNASAAAGSAAVASSGPKVVNINVSKFFDNINFNTTSLQESTAKIEEAVLEVLSRVLVQGASMA